MPFNPDNPFSTDNPKSIAAIEEKKRELDAIRIENILRYQVFFACAKNKNELIKCINFLFKLELQKYCSRYFTGTDEELQKTYKETEAILKERVEDYYLEYLSQVKEIDRKTFREFDENNTLKSYIEFLINSSKVEFDSSFSKNKMTY